jgi:dynein heavy chain
MMPYTQEATIKTHFMRLKGFVKLTESLLIDSKVRMARNASEALYTQVMDMNDLDSEAGGGVCWLSTRVSVVDGVIVFEPT